MCVVCFVVLSCVLRCGIAGPHVSKYLKKWGSAKTASQSRCVTVRCHCASSRQWMRISVPRHPCQDILLSVFFFNYCDSRRYEADLFVVFDLHFPNDSSCWVSFFGCPCLIYASFVNKWLFKSLAIYKTPLNCGVWVSYAPTPNLDWMLILISPVIMAWYRGNQGPLQSSRSQWSNLRMELNGNTRVGSFIINYKENFSSCSEEEKEGGKGKSHAM